MISKHPYLTATLVATLLAVVVWLCVPKEYTAVTKLSDEYKEMDLAIGLDDMMAKIKKAMSGDGNEGMNDMAVYSKVLVTEDFARRISHKQVPGKGVSYGEYLTSEDTIDAVIDNINYNYSSRKETLTISFTDRDPLVAAQMLDSVTAELQHILTAYRHRLADAAYQNSVRELHKAKTAFEEAEKAYTTYAEANSKAVTKQSAQYEISLEKEMTAAYRHYEKVVQEYTRQQALKQRINVPFAVVSPNSVPVSDNSHLASYLLPFLIVTLLAVKGYRQYQLKKHQPFITDWGDFFSPWCLTVVVWAGDILLYYLQGTLDPIGPSFLNNFSLWLLTFLPCSILTYWLFRDQTHSIDIDHRRPIDVNIVFFYFLVVLSLFMTVLYAKAIYGIVSQFDTENMLYNIRLLAVSNTESFGVLNHTQGINIGLFLVAIWLYPRISKWMVALVVVINLIMELALMEKSGVLIMILGALFVLYERRRIKVRTIGLTMVGIIVLFFFFNMSKEDADSEESMTFMDFFGMYVTSPMIAFEHLRETISSTFATNTLNDFYPQLLRFGINVDVIDRLQEFVYVPIPTNVYTIMQPFYNDFGSVGVAFFGFLYGSCFGFVYCRFREGSSIFKCFYTYLVEVIIIQFYNENLLQVFHLVFEAALIIIVLVELGKVRLYGSRRVLTYENTTS